MACHQSRRRLLSLTAAGIASAPWNKGLALTAEARRSTQTDRLAWGAELAGSDDNRVAAHTAILSDQPPSGVLALIAKDSEIERIDQARLKAFVSWIPPGLSSLVSRYKNFYLRLYPSRRPVFFPAGAPYGLADPVFLRHPGLSEQVRNNPIARHLWRHTGGSMVRISRNLPVQPLGQTYILTTRTQRFYASHLRGAVPGLFFAAKIQYLGPAALQGDQVLVHEFLPDQDRTRAAWIYNAGQRRVRRAPDLAYDAVADGSEGLFTADQVDGFNGALDRFEWQSLGKKALIVPYNWYGLSGPWSADDLRRRVVGAGVLNADLLRFEWHRVWVVQAILKPGQSHIYSRRVFYVDEDSATVLVEECYSSRGELWRVSLHGLIQDPEGQTPVTRASVYHDLTSGRYFAAGFDAESGPSMIVGKQAEMNNFTTDSLRRN
ncbi:MAG: DUF1329 domain-containing protein [Burkholderiaceae bacterium]